MLGLLLAVTLATAAESAVFLGPSTNDISVGTPGDISYAFGQPNEPPPLSDFKPLPRWQLGSHAETLWLRVRVRFDPDLQDQQSYWIEVDEHPDRARLYREGSYDLPISSTGALIPPPERPLNNQRVLLRLPAQPGDGVHYLIAIESVLPLSGYLRVFSPLGLEAADHLRDVYMALFVGFMIAMLLLNLLMFRYTRENLYLYYAALQPWYFLFPIWELGYGQRLFPDSAPYYQFIGNFSGLACILAMAIFATRISDLRKSHPNLNAVILGLSTLNIFILFLIQTPNLIFAMISVVVLLLLLSGGILSIRNGDRASRFWTAGITMVLCCGIFFILTEQGFLGVNLNLENIVTILAIAAIFDSVAFALSISERLNQNMQNLIDKQSELIRRLEVQRQAAEVSNIAKEQFLMNTNHELQTPLTAIIGFADMILEKVGDHERHASVIKKSAVRLTQILKDIVDFSSTKRGTIVLSLSEFNVCQVLCEVMELLAPEAERRKIHLQNECAEDHEAIVRADRARTRQILWNLLGNAVRFTERGQIYVGVKLAEDHVCIWVKDSGSGIENSLQDQIFVGFMQADGTTKRAQHGLGLGLALSRELAQIQGGEVRLVWSEVDRGSEFEVRLPTPEAAAKSVEIRETNLRASWLRL
ncbi:MAG: sensor histidine kinase [Bdellovibrionales bacterium]|nr:sensor histidine kinase [Bdellovibrionales bacterium]